MGTVVIVYTILFMYKLEVSMKREDRERFGQLVSSFLSA